MAKLSVKVIGLESVQLGFFRLPPKVQGELELKVRALADELRTKVMVEHLSGPTGPHTLSVGQNSKGHTGGQLRASVFQDVKISDTSVRGRVGFSGDVVYAAIHEFGGVINIPEIIPTKAKALKFMIQGREVFARKVRAHTVTIPERAPLRTSFKEMLEKIVTGIKEAVFEGVFGR